MIIAIDGPSGAGKSTVSKEVAKQLGFACLDTGAMYRCIAWYALQDGISLDDDVRLGALAYEKPITFKNEPGDPSPKAVYIDGIDVTKEIRTAQIDRAVSPVSAIPVVREALTDQQRRIGQNGDYVVEGRDIGTVVFPHADLKIFLTASDEVRAQRRVLQNKERGIGSTDYDEVLAGLRNRDAIDSSRDTAPLKAASDAILIDSSHLSQDEVIQKICDLAKEHE